MFELAQRELKIDEKASIIPHSATPYRWSGLIKIHGSLQYNETDLKYNQNDHSEELVLSSADFGRAYLKEAYAARFITELFNHFNVLFIGYSLSDPVLKYIVDAYAVDIKNDNKNAKKAYILLPESNNKNEGLYLSGVTVFNYSNKEGDHKGLYDHLNILTEINSNLYEKNEKIRQLKKYTDDQDQQALLEMHFATDPKIISFFFKWDSKKPETIADIKWLEHFATKKMGLPVINEDSTSIESIDTHLLISGWLCQHIYKPELIDWIFKNNGILHPILHARLSQELGNYTDSPYYDIISLLLNNIVYKNNNRNILNGLNNEIRKLKSIPIGLKLRILDALKPQIIIKYNNYQKIKHEKPQDFLRMMCLEINSYAIKELNKSLTDADMIADVAQELVILLKQYCDIAVLLNPDNYKPYNVMSHISNDDDQANMRYQLSCLVQLLRNSTKSLITKNSHKGLSLVETMLDDGINNNSYAVFIRLSLYLLSDNTESADQRIALLWRYRQGWFYEIDCKQEAGDFVKNIWPNLSHEWQEKFWNAIREDIKNSISNKTNIAKDICHRISWVGAQPDIPEDIKKFLLNNSYEADSDIFRDTNYQKCKSVVYPDIYNKEVDYNEFIGYNVEQHIALLNEAKDVNDRFYQPNNSSVLWNQWVGKDFNSAFQKLIEITEKEFYQKAWNYLIQGINLENENLDLLQFITTLDSFDSKNLKLLTNNVASLLSRLNKDKTPTICEDTFISLFYKLLPYTVETNLVNHDSTFSFSDKQQLRYYEDALNHPYGNIAIALIEFMINKSGGKGSNVPQSFISYFNNLLKAAKDKECIIYANTILTNNLYNLYVLIPQWTEENVIPLLEWLPSNKEKAYNTYQYWYSYLLDLNLTEELAKKIAQALKDLLKTENLELFDDCYIKERLIDLTLFMYKKKHIEISDIASYLQKYKKDVLDVINKNNINLQDYDFYKKVTNYLNLSKDKSSKEFKIISPILAQIFVKLLISDVNCSVINQKDWEEYWSNYFDYINHTHCIYEIIQNGESKKTNLNIIVLLQFLHQITDPSDLSLEYSSLKEILDDILKVDETAVDNNDYKNLRAYVSN
ncbi:Sir2 C-terminal domain containing protein (plasmid) [Candidatus Trichorickettsia mobilis]|nr:Sir2 C-terminal domain containing protein [Candidatus Trichorickettsia mobilis]